MKFVLSLMLTLTCLLQPVPAFAIAGSSTTPRPGDDDPVATPSPTPDAELERLKRETALAEEKQKKAEAEQAELEARRAKLKAATEPFGDTNKVTAPSGDVKTDDKGFVEVRMLSLEAARKISDDLAKDLCEFPGVHTLVIYDETELKAIVLSRTMVTQLQALSKELDDRNEQIKKKLAETDPTKLEPSLSLVNGLRETARSNFLLNATGDLSGILGPMAIPGVAAGLISSIAQLANLFRSDTELKSKDVQIPEDMAVSYLVTALSKTGCGKMGIYYPHLYPTNLFADNSTSPLLKAVNDVRTSKQNVAESLKAVAKRIKHINDIAEAIDARDELVDRQHKLEKEHEELLAIDPHCKRSKCRKLNEDIATVKGDIKHAEDGINEATNNSEGEFQAKYKRWLQELKNLTAETQPLVDAADEIISKLDKLDATTNTTALAQLLQAERLGQVLTTIGTYMLRMAVSANGTTKIKKNMFIDAKIRHSAGADLVYQLFDSGGRVVLADATQFYYDYQSASQVREMVANSHSQQMKSHPHVARNATKPKTQKSGQN